LEAEASEPGVTGERLALLSVVRGLEALQRPSRVMLVTPSSYVREGIRRGLSEWRRNGWRWERFGQMVPVKHLDLWQRVDRAMQYHQLDCRMCRIDPPHRGERGATPAGRLYDGNPAGSNAAPRGLQYRPGRSVIRLGAWIVAVVRGWIRQLAPLRTALDPRIWLG
jgi:ribonuclease HI